MTRERATAIGFAAVVLWAFFALLIVATAPMPPLLVNTVVFTVAGLAGLGWTAARGRLGLLARVPAVVYAIGVGGLFGYHLLYVHALRLAPPAEAMLVGYVWPLLIVLGSTFLPGEVLRPGHVLGGAVAFAGAGLVVLGGGGFSGGALPGYLLSLGAAVVWAVYSLLSRRFGRIPTDVVGVFCLGTAALALPLHLLTEATVWPAAGRGWAVLLALGLGPVGFAYFAWDIGMKQGNVQLLGVISYATPLLSTLILVLAGVTEPRPVLLVSAVLISAGALVAARAGLRRPTPG